MRNLSCTFQVKNSNSKDEKTFRIFKHKKFNFDSQFPKFDSSNPNLDFLEFKKFLLNTWISRGVSGFLAVVRQFGCLGHDALVHVLHHGIYDRHYLAGNCNVRVHLQFIRQFKKIVSLIASSNEKNLSVFVEKNGISATCFLFLVSSVHASRSKLLRFAFISASSHSDCLFENGHHKTTVENEENGKLAKKNEQATKKGRNKCLLHSSSGHAHSFRPS